MVRKFGALVPSVQIERWELILRREKKEKKEKKAVTVIGVVECGTKPGSTKPTWKLYRRSLCFS